MIRRLFQLTTEYFKKHILIVQYFYSCNDVMDDPFLPCVGCDDSTPRSSFDRRNGFQNGHEDKSFEFKERQGGETIRATGQGKRIICSRGSRTRRRCRLRISRAIEYRRSTYFQFQRFIQAEQYLSSDDLQIIRLFH